jgi:hypothetical protein
MSRDPYPEPPEAPRPPKVRKPRRRITRANVEEASLTELVRVYRLAALVSWAKAVGTVAWAVVGLVLAVYWLLILLSRVTVVLS